MSHKGFDARLLGTLACAVLVAAAVLERTAAGGGATVPKGVERQLHQSVAGFFGSQQGLTRRRARVLARSRDATLYGIHDRRGS